MIRRMTPGQAGLAALAAQRGAIPFIPHWRVSDEWERDVMELGWRVACWLIEENQ